MRKRTKRKVRKFFGIILLFIITFIVLIVILFKPGNPFTTNIKLQDSKDYSKFELRKVTLLSMKEFLNVPAKLNGITYNENKSSHEREEWAKIYNVDKNKVIVLYIKYKTYSDAEKKDYKNNYTYKTSWVFVKEKKGWVLRSKIK